MWYYSLSDELRRWVSVDALAASNRIYNQNWFKQIKFYFFFLNVKSRTEHSRDGSVAQQYHPFHPSIPSLSLWQRCLPQGCRMAESVKRVALSQENITKRERRFFSKETLCHIPLRPHWLGLGHMLTPRSITGKGEQECYDWLTIVICRTPSLNG